MDYPLCKGVGCDALLRPHGAHREDHPGTRLEAHSGLCFACARAKRASRNLEVRKVAPIDRELNPSEKRVLVMVETRFDGGDLSELIGMLGITGHEEVPTLTGLETMSQPFTSQSRVSGYEL